MVKLSVRLPGSLHQSIRLLAQQEGVDKLNKSVRFNFTLTPLFTARFGGLS